MRPDWAGRLALAMGLSALMHAWVLGGFAVGSLPEPDSGVSVLRTRLVAAEPQAPEARRRRSVQDPVAAATAHEAPLESVEQSVGGSPATPAQPRDTSGAFAPPAASDTAEYDPRPRLDMPRIVDATVYAPHELDTFPEPLAPLRLTAPGSSTQASGGVTLELVIDERGFVTHAQEVESDAGIVAARTWLDEMQSVRFSPAQRDGRAVRARIAIRVEISAGADPTAAPR